MYLSEHGSHALSLRSVESSSKSDNVFVWCLLQPCAFWLVFNDEPVGFLLPEGCLDPGGDMETLISGHLGFTLTPWLHFMGVRSHLLASDESLTEES